MAPVPMWFFLHLHIVIFCGQYFGLLLMVPIGQLVTSMQCSYINTATRLCLSYSIRHLLSSAKRSICHIFFLENAMSPISDLGKLLHLPHPPPAKILYPLWITLPLRTKNKQSCSPPIFCYTPFVPTKFVATLQKSIGLRVQKFVLTRGVAQTVDLGADSGALIEFQSCSLWSAPNCARSVNCRFVVYFKLNLIAFNRKACECGDSLSNVSNLYTQS